MSARAWQAAEILSFLVILSETKNLSLAYVQSTDRFFGEKRATE